MRFNPRIWLPLSRILAVVNVGAVWFAAQAAEPTHATIHAALAAAFAVWSERVRQRRVSISEAALADMQDQLEGLQAESRGQVAELQDRLDFAERLLAQERRMQGVRPPEPPAT
jgi:membrane protein implicated in regulation of membrane protease activity